MKLVKKYHKLGFVLTPLKPLTKEPSSNGWSSRSGSDAISVEVDTTDDDPAKWKIVKQNVGLKNAFSGLAVVDVDDLSALMGWKNGELWKHLKRSMGIRYGSGKDNRLKILYRVPKDAFNTVALPKGVDGQIRCGDGNGGSVMDVLPPSVLKDGRKYKWIDCLPSKFDSIPVLPRGVCRYIKKQLRDDTRAKKRSETDVSGSGYPWTNAVNNYCRSNGLIELFMELLMNDSVGFEACYEEAPKGEGYYRRIGSTNTGPMKVSADGSHITNWSDKEEQPLPFNYRKEKGQPISAWDILVARFGSVSEARRLVCNGDLDKELMDVIEGHGRFEIMDEVTRLKKEQN